MSPTPTKAQARRDAVPADPTATTTTASTTGPSTGGSGLPPASDDAKRLAAAILEVLAGARGPAQAAEVLGISLCRYYQLETRAINGLLAACESGRRRKGRGPINELAALRQECDRLRRECGRQQALVRAAQRTVGLTTPLPPPAPRTTGSKKRRKRRPTARALKVAALLQAEVQQVVPVRPDAAVADENGVSPKPDA